MKRKAIAIVLTVLMLIGILFSYHFIIEEAHHKCMGKQCPICAQIDDSIQFIMSIKFVPILPFIVAVLFMFAKWVAHKAKYICVNDTLISLKVELLD
jgi:hypothetical protein